MTEQQEVAALKARVDELKQVLTVMIEALENIDVCGSIALTPELRNYLTTARGLLYAPKLRHMVRRRWTLMPPTYAYLCEAGHEFEVEQRITDEPLTVCMATESCGYEDGARLACLAPCRRLISRTSFVLQGKGWGRDGYSG